MSLFNPNIKASATDAYTQAVPAPRMLVPTLPGLGGDDVLAASSAVAPSARFTPPARMTRPFISTQAATLEYSFRSIDEHGGVLIGDEPGMGKTQSMLALVDHFTHEAGPGSYAIMVAPAVAIAGYRQDIRDAFPHLVIEHLYGHKVYARKPADIYFLTDDGLTLRHWLTNGIVKVPDDKGGKDKERVLVSPFAAGASIITIDELHHMKGDQGKPSLRAKVMLAVANELRGKAPIVGATGTLLTNRPVEAFLQLQIVGGEKLVKILTPGSKSLAGFLYRYTMPVEKIGRNGRKVTDFSGADHANLVNLNEYLRRTVYARHLRSDTGLALPHGGWLIKPVALNGALDHYNDLVENFLPTLFATKGKLAAERAARAEQLRKIMSIWEEAGIAKSKMAVEYVTELTDQGRKVVVFYYHGEVFDRMSKGLMAAGVELAVINGDVTDDPRTGRTARSDEVDRFQNGTAQVMMVQVTAGGQSVTLTAAADAVFVQVPWSAGDLKQAADRILRIDQRSQDRGAAGEAVTWHVLQAAQPDGRNTFDQVMWGVLENKAQVIDAVNQGHELTMPDGSIMEAVLEAWYDQLV